jgi:hypothetical protein
MKADPVSLALRNVVETKYLLESLIRSSESFDYPQAKAALKKLERKIKELSKLQGQLETRTLPRQSNVQVVDFRPTPSPTRANC